MINTRIGISLMGIAVALSMAGGAAFAYFSETAQSTGNTLTTGSLDISITDQNADTEFTGESIVSNWAPGQEALVNFDVKNVGTIPVNFRGSASGTWGNPALDVQNMVKVTKVERWNGAAWETIAANNSGITGDIYYSPTGTNTALFELAPNERAQLQLTVVLDETAGNDFQTETFTATLGVDAKQTNASF